MAQLRNNANFSKKQLRTQRLIGAKNGTIKKKLKTNNHTNFITNSKQQKGTQFQKNGRITKQHQFQHQLRMTRMLKTKINTTQTFYIIQNSNIYRGQKFQYLVVLKVFSWQDI